ncbi:MAG: methyltransferase domain-containing protein [Solirubrobacteraceae bacterium]
MIDPAAFRTTSRERWETAAPGWEARRADLQAAAEPVSRWMVDVIDPQPGQTVLELAAGVGDTGFLAAERIQPGGRLICTDGAEPMLDAARRRAAELGLDNVEFEAMEAEWIDSAAASLDAVLCRWGYMLLADPEAALRETRRVLRSGGRLALAAWDGPERNPWVAHTHAELLERGLTAPPQPGEPGMFSFAADGVIAELLYAAGFEDVRVEAVDLTFSAVSFDDWFEYLFDTSPSLAAALAGATPEQRDEVHDGIEARLALFRAADGSLALPGRTLVAAASA